MFSTNLECFSSGFSSGFGEGTFVVRMRCEALHGREHVARVFPHVAECVVETELVAKQRMMMRRRRKEEKEEEGGSGLRLVSIDWRRTAPAEIGIAYATTCHSIVLNNEEEEEEEE